MSDRQDKRTQLREARERERLRKERRWQSLGGVLLVLFSLAILGAGAYFMLTGPSTIESSANAATSAFHGDKADVGAADCRELSHMVERTPNGDKVDFGRESQCVRVPYKTPVRFLIDASLIIWLPLFLVGLYVLFPRNGLSAIGPGLVAASIALAGAAYVLDSGLTVNVASTPLTPSALTKFDVNAGQELLYSQAVMALSALVVVSLVSMVHSGVRSSLRQPRHLRRDHG